MCSARRFCKIKKYIVEKERGLSRQSTSKKMAVQQQLIYFLFEQYRYYCFSKKWNILCEEPRIFVSDPM